MTEKHNICYKVHNQFQIQKIYYMLEIADRWEIKVNPNDHISAKHDYQNDNGPT